MNEDTGTSTSAPAASGAAQVARNVSAIYVAQIIVRGLTFAYNILLARYLGVGRFGQYTFAFAVVALMGTAGEWGLGWLAVREMPRHRDRIGYYLSNLLGLTLVSTILVGVVLFAFHWIRGTSRSAILATILVLTYWLCTSLVDVIYGVFRTDERLDLEGALRLAEKVCSLGLGLYLMWRRAGVLCLVAAVTAGGALNVILSWWLMRRRGVAVLPRWDLGGWPKLARQALSMHVPVLTMRAYYRIDMVLLPMLKSEAALGLYAAARKPLDALGFMPGFFVTAIMPRLSLYARDDPTRYRMAASKSVKFIAFLGSGLAVALFICAPRLVPALMGAEYEPAARLLRVVVWSFVLMLVNQTLWGLFVSADHERAPMRAAAVALAANVVLNGILIPAWGPMGAAAALLVTESVAAVLLVRAIRRQELGPDVMSWGWRLAVAAAAGVGGGLACPLPVYLQTLLGAAAFLATCAVVGVFDADDSAAIRAAVSRPHRAQQGK